MNENTNKQEDQIQRNVASSTDDSKPEETIDVIESVSSPDSEKAEVVTNKEEKQKKNLSKKKIGIISGIAAAVVVVIVIALVLSQSDRKFDEVKAECVQIAGSISSGKGYFTIETIPDSWDNMEPTLRAIMISGHQQDALNAIKYANDELGFPGVYSQMLNTTALMGRQSDENSKYKVAWTYHPDDGLTVTYSKK